MFIQTLMILGAVFGTVGAACGSTGMEFEAFGLDVSSFLLVSVCLGFSMAAAGMVEGCFWTTATDIGGQRRGLAGAFMNTGGNAGGLIAPVLTPLMAAKINYSGSIVVACVISLVGGLLWFAIRPTVTTEWSDD